jgi:hypothetical protein
MMKTNSLPYQNPLLTVSDFVSAVFGNKKTGTGHNPVPVLGFHRRECLPYRIFYR